MHSFASSLLLLVHGFILCQIGNIPKGIHDFETDKLHAAVLEALLYEVHDHDVAGAGPNIIGRSNIIILILFDVGSRLVSLIVNSASLRLFFEKTCRYVALNINVFRSHTVSTPNCKTQ